MYPAFSQTTYHDPEENMIELYSLEGDVLLARIYDYREYRDTMNQLGWSGDEVYGKYVDGTSAGAVIDGWERERIARNYTLQEAANDISKQQYPHPLPHEEGYV